MTEHPSDPDSLHQTFQELRAWIDDRMVAKKLRPHRISQRRGEETKNIGITRADIDQLKADIATLIELDGRKSFWSGLISNTIFFVLGIFVAILIDFIKTYG